MPTTAPTTPAAATSDDEAALRATALLLRTAAHAAATPGRTRYHRAVTDLAGIPVLTDHDQDPATVIQVHSRQYETVLAWLRLIANPEIGLLLAAWFDSHADDTALQAPDPRAVALAHELLTTAPTPAADGIRQARLSCISDISARAVTAALRSSQDGDGNTVRVDGRDVVITYTDPRWPEDVADWAQLRGHCTEQSAARLQSALDCPTEEGAPC